jgi:hypothetical protein
VGNAKPRDHHEDVKREDWFRFAGVLGPVDLFRERLGATAKAARSINLLREGFGERELPGLLWVSASRDTAVEKAKAAEREDGEARMEGDLHGYNIIGTQSGYLAIAQWLGPIRLFEERVAYAGYAGCLGTSARWPLI